MSTFRTKKYFRRELYTDQDLKLYNYWTFTFEGLTDGAQKYTHNRKKCYNIYNQKLTVSILHYHRFAEYQSDPKQN